MKFSATALSLLAAAGAVRAHFTLDYPATRGFDEDLEPNFCGGFNESSTRVPFSLDSSPLLIDSHHPSAQVGIFISFDQNPTSFADFNQTSSGQAYPMLMPFGTINGQGEWCFNVDVASLNVPNVGNGTLATIQVEFNGGDGILFQCSDVILVENLPTPANVTSMCQNTTSNAASTSSGAPTATGSTGAATQTKKSAANKVGVAGAAAGVLALAGAVVVGW
ncbi:SPOSA6832_02378, partial [Sporobolomyces salmonicolor]